MSISGAAVKVSITVWDVANQTGKTGLMSGGSPASGVTFTLTLDADGGRPTAARARASPQLPKTATANTRYL